MHRQSKTCRDCYTEVQRTPERREVAAQHKRGKPSYERTPEIRKKMSDSQKRRKRKTGWHHSKTTCGKMAAHWTPERREAKRLEQQLIYEDYANRLAIAKKLTGEQNPNYQGKTGNCYGPGYGAKYARMLRRKINHCEQCGKTDCHLHLHHKDFGTTNHLLENLVCLCVSCHFLIHSEHRKSQKA